MNSPFVVAAGSGWYGGLNIGQSVAKIDQDRIRSGLLEGGFVTTSVSDDHRDAGYKHCGDHGAGGDIARQH